MGIKPKVRAGLLAAMTSLMFPWHASGEDIRLRVPKLNFLEEYRSFPCGESLYVKVRDFDKSRYPNLRARLFCGTKKELPERYYRVVQGSEASGARCFIYDSRTLPMRANRLGINLGALPPAGRWLVVFEDGDWGNGAIKISESAVGDYFRRGYEFSVETPPKPRVFPSIFGTSATKLTTAAPATSPPTRSLQSVEFAASDKVACIRFRNVNDETLIAEAGHCSGCARPTHEETSFMSWLLQMGSRWAH